MAAGGRAGGGVFLTYKPTPASPLRMTSPWLPVPWEEVHTQAANPPPLASPQLPCASLSSELFLEEASLRAYLEAFAQAVPSTWNTFPVSSPASLLVLLHVQPDSLGQGVQVTVPLYPYAPDTNILHRLFE